MAKKAPYKLKGYKAVFYKLYKDFRENNDKCEMAGHAGYLYDRYYVKKKKKKKKKKNFRSRVCRECKKIFFCLDKKFL